MQDTKRNEQKDAQGARAVARVAHLPMLNTNELVPGRIYTLIYESDFEMVGFRKLPTRKDNPLANASVQVKRKFKVQAAGKKTWEIIQKRKNPAWQPSADYSQWWHPFYTEAQLLKPEDKRNSCIVENNKTASRYLRGIPKGIISEEFTIDGQPATEEQIAIAKEFKKNKGGEFLFIELPKLNIIDETDDSEDDENFDVRD